MQTKQSQSHLQMRALTEGAVMVALATALGYLKLFELPQGGAVCIGMLPLFLYCVRWGLGKGLVCCFAYGVLQLIFDGAYAWGWTSMLLDYILAYGIIGFTGVLRGKKGGIFWATVVGCVLRFVVHFISGVTIYRIYAPEQLFNTTFTNPWLYSAAYNGSYVGLDMVLCLVIFALLSHPMRKYLTGQDLAV